MNSRLDKIKFIAEKTELLVNQNKEKDNKIQQLTNEVNSLTAKLTELNRNLEAVQNENENLKVVGSSTVEPAKSNVSQQEIDKMIKEIDECLALLNI